MDISSVKVKKRFGKIVLGKNGKPYIKKWGNYKGFAVWVVDGEYIRKNICEDFVSYDSHLGLSFIPGGEFWIEKDNIHSEEKYYIHRLYLENKLISEGWGYKEAEDRAELIEKSERGKEKEVGKLRKGGKEGKIKRVHKILWRQYSSNNLKVWIVNGKLVRSLFFVDYAEGGHDYVYKFIPSGEIWIDDDILSEKERKLILIHELHERKWMKKGFVYHRAHKLATKIEDKCRHNSKLIDKQLEKEIRINER